MSRSKQSKYVAIFLSGLFLTSVMYFYSSAWFIWSLLPTSDLGQKIVLSNPSSTTAFKFISGLLGLSKEEIAFLTKSRVVGIVRNGEGQLTMVFHPSLRNQLSIKKELSLLGWNTKREGLLLYASKGEKEISGLSSWWKATGQALTSFIFKPVPLFPVAIALTDTPNDLQKVFIVATEQDDYLQVLATSHANNIGKLKKVINTSSVEGLTIAIPSSNLSLLPDAIRREWSDKLLNQLGFQKTKPDILSYLSQFSNVKVRSKDDGLLISSSGAGDAFVDVVNKWLIEEESRQKPKRKSFTLPDGSYGFEQVPGKVNDMLNKEDGGCYRSLNSNIKLWMCKSDQGATLSTNKEWLEKEKQSDVSDKWEISFDNNWAKKFVNIDIKSCQANDDSSSLVCFLDDVSFVSARGSSVGDHLVIRLRRRNLSVAK